MRKVEHESVSPTLSLGERGRVREVLTLTLSPLPEGEGDLALHIASTPKAFQNPDVKAVSWLSG
jgi:hypothetical protein